MIRSRETPDVHHGDVDMQEYMSPAIIISHTDKHDEKCANACAVCHVIGQGLGPSRWSSAHDASNTSGKIGIA